MVYCQNHSRAYVCGIRNTLQAHKCKSDSCSWRGRHDILPILKRLAKLQDAATAVCETAEESCTLDVLFLLCHCFCESSLKDDNTALFALYSGGDRPGVRGERFCTGGKEHAFHLCIPLRSCWALHQLVVRVGWAGRSKNRYSRLRKINSNKWQREGRVKRECA